MNFHGAVERDVRAHKYTDRFAGDLHGTSDLQIAGAMLYRLQRKKNAHFGKVDFSNCLTVIFQFKF